MAGNAQFVPIQDTSLASYLCQLRPFVTSQDCKMLDTAAASNNDINLYLNNRGIKKAEEIIYFKNTDLIYLQKNGLTSLPNLSSLRGDLEVLDVSFNKLSRLQGLEKLTRIRSLNASNNKLSSFSDLSLATRLEYVNLSFNLLSFKDFNPLTKSSNFPVYNLMPQSNLTPDTSIEVLENSSFSINVPIDEGVANVYYSWQKNGMPISADSRFPSLKLSKVTQKDTGSYVMYVGSTNSKLTYISVNSGPIRIRMKPCQQLQQYELIPKIDCEGSFVTLSSLTLSNDNSDFESFLENGITGSKTKLHYQQPMSIEAGNYHFIVTDGKNCSIKKENVLKINLPVGSCPIVFTPNGDGFQDELFLDGSSDAYVLNKEGKNIKTLHLPCYWDGSDYAGNNVPLGSYLLIRKDGTQEKITVLR